MSYLASGRTDLRVGNLEVESSRNSVFQVSKELGFENTVDQGIRLLRRAHTEGEPIVFERRCSDEFDSPNRDDPLSRYR